MKTQTQSTSTPTSILFLTCISLQQIIIMLLLRTIPFITTTASSFILMDKNINHYQVQVNKIKFLTRSSSSSQQNQRGDKVTKLDLFASAASAIPNWADSFGASAIGQVQNLASLVSAASEGEQIEQQNQKGKEGKEEKKDEKKEMTYLMSGDTDAVFSNLTEQRGIKGQNRKVVLSALESLERDSEFVCLLCLIIMSY